jgi:cell division septal protein FtsQ
MIESLIPLMNKAATNRKSMTKGDKLAFKIFLVILAILVFLVLWWVITNKP